MRDRFVVLWAVASLALVCPALGGHRVRAQEPARPTGASLGKALMDRSLWGPGFFGVLAALPTLAGAGETRITITADRVLGGTRHATMAEAASAAQALAGGLREPDSRHLAMLRRLVAGAPTRPAPLRVQPVQLLEDASFRIAVTSPDAPLLAPGLGLDAVVRALGPAGTPRKVLIDNGTERRPTVLTIYSFAGGALTFAQSDVSPHPELIDRASLDVRAALAALSKEDRR